MVRLYLDTYSLSVGLPNSFNIDQVDGSVEVSLFLQGRWVYTTRLYADSQGITTFYEFRQIVEQYMLSHELAVASLEISVDYGQGGEQYEDKYIVFSRYNNTNDYYIDFLNKHFLVNRTYLTMPREKYNSLPFFITPEEGAVTAYFDCIFEQDGELVNIRVNNNIASQSVPRVYYLTCSPPSVKYMADRQEGEDCGKLLSFTAHVGLRSMTVYVTDDTPSATFYFLNSYNAQETIHIFGTTTFKTAVSKKEAYAFGESSFYDKSIERKWEVKTVALTQEEALWFNEFLESDVVYIDITQDYDHETILISDITSEISDSSKDLVHIKFSWKFSNGTRWINEDRYLQQFTAPFNDVFK